MNMANSIFSKAPVGKMKPLTKQLTLCFAFSDSNRENVLLGWKKRGFGSGKYNGFGGKVEKNETIRAATVRELYEESGLVVDESAIQQVGRIHFEFVGDPVWLDVHIFATETYSGTVTESDEMKPSWFKANYSTLPFAEMWADDKHWFPFLLSGLPFFGYFQFLGHEKILRYTIKQLDGFKDSDFEDTKIPWYTDAQDVTSGDEENICNENRLNFT